ncbi:MAG TPA: DedA family protein [Bacteroidales bacterium]|nr:DedA family protein [Bacteroidales bacterium]
MPEELAGYIMKYGYLAIFIMVFLQETGFPNPVPNELLLIFSGYLSSRGILSFSLAALIVVIADLTGTLILFHLFRGAGQILLKKLHIWFPRSAKAIEKVRSGISRGGVVSIFVFRITPFTRGYTSVISGLTGIRPRKYYIIAIITATLWTLFYISLGYLLGPSWDYLNNRTNDFQSILLIMLILTTILIVAMFVSRWWKNRKEEAVS